MKATLTVCNNYFSDKSHAGNLDVCQYSKGHFLDKFQPLYDQMKKEFGAKGVSGHSCSNNSQKIGVVMPQLCYSAGKITKEGRLFCEKILAFLKPYGFTQLVFLF